MFVFYLFLGSGGVVYGFIGVNISWEFCIKFMFYYRVICMFGVMLFMIGRNNYK